MTKSECNLLQNLMSDDMLCFGLNDDELQIDLKLLIRCCIDNRA